MTKPSQIFTIQKVRYGTNTPWYGLKISDFVIPYPYNDPNDVVVALYADTTIGAANRILNPGTDYTLHPTTGQLQLNEENLGLDQQSGLSVVLSTARNTTIPNITFTPGHPIRANDLNDLFNAHTLKIEELEARQGAVFSEVPPPGTAAGQLWVSSTDFRIYCWTGDVWVDVR